MRPLKLTLTAFGPYREQEVVDFQQLKHHRLFVVSGKTGAGKTTIFDGISYALYGSASGEDRDQELSLRSDFADDHLHTSVELLFEINGERYRVFRQMAHVKQGNKTATGGRTELFRVTSSGEVPSVDRQTKSDVDDKLRAIVGLTQDQFRQIVMLPQGEFRKLLTSNTENKEAILRRIFQTVPYHQLIDQLKEKRQRAKQESDQALTLRDQYIQAIHNKLPLRDDSTLQHVLNQEQYNVNQVLNGLSEERVFYEQQSHELNEQKRRLQDDVEKRTTHIQRAKTIQEQRQNLKEKQERLETLKAEQETVNQKESELHEAERAAAIEPYEQQYNDLLREVKEQQQALDTLSSKRKRAHEQLNQALAAYEAEQNRESTRQQLHDQLSRLQDIYPKVKQLKDQETALNRLQTELKQTDKRRKQLGAEVDHKQRQMNASKAELEQLDQATDDYAALVEKRQMKREHYQIVKEYVQQYQALQEQEQLLQQEKNTYEKEKSQLDHLESSWLNNQASLLASHLHDGEACPVCGSVEHPNKQTVTVDAPTKEVLEEARQQANQAYGRVSRREGQLQSIEQAMQSAEQRVLEIGESTAQPEETLERIYQEGLKLKQQVEEKERQQAALKQLKQSVKTEEEALQQLLKEQEQLEQTYQSINTRVQTEERAYHDLLNDIPEDVRQLEQLETKINRLTQKKERMKQAWEQAQTAYQQAQKDVTTVDTQWQETQTHLKERISKQQHAYETYQQQCLEAGFSDEEHYNQAKRSNEVRDQLRQDIESYRQEVSVLTEQVKELNETLANETEEDIAKLEQQLAETKSSLEQLSKEYDAHVRLRDTIDDLKYQLEANQHDIAAKEKQLGRYTDLHDLVRGQNDLKLSLERYLQIDYLNQIIEAANIRLRHLSNGQFYLVRSQRQESHGRQSGLGLDVFDVYTGQERDVKTMSGGEKFNASLCLALGMSDVIQSYQGGVSIETMFIDEGFGSLDDESLNKAIDTLIDLQKSGRMIGVISHVEALKSAIPAVLNVSKTPDGLSQTHFVVD
ncbi:exonuclease SbcC [Alkalibacillus flavidus]|uniref:Nuclease SbcCD subunit C n=1 Tax=Alkalibacillus flavidus TaxID=546021 RepID=A0ABV2KX32_9BACI